MECSEIKFSRHAVQRMFSRGIEVSDIAEAIRVEDVVEEYPSDSPFPSKLMMGSSRAGPFHTVVARDAQSGTCVVITVYWPDKIRWLDDFRRRRLP